MTSDWVHCPYNPEHYMPPGRLKWHLSRPCRDMLRLSHLFSICPYNSLHHILTAKLGEHVQTCPYRAPALVPAEKRVCAALSPDPPNFCWEPTWPKEHPNLNYAYIPEPAKNHFAYSNDY